MNLSCQILIRSFLQKRHETQFTNILYTVLRIHLFWCVFPVRILDPQWKKWIRIRNKVMNISFKINQFFLTKENFRIW